MGHRERRIEAIVIAGPTASGKSALALRLATRLRGTVVNADSMQVYHDLRVLTARPDANAEALVPHRLYGTVDGAVPFSVSRWLEAVAAALAEARAAERLPIVVGGTGLYLKALTQGLSPIPAVPASIRDEVRRWATERPAAALHVMLAERDPATAARLRPTDPQRIARALEVHLATGRSLAAFHEQREPPLLPPEACVALALTPDRQTLRARVDARFSSMVEEGGLAEAESLAARALPSTLPVMRALGVAPLLAHLRGELSLAEAVAQGQGDTRAYFKRQDTFARRQLPEFQPVAPEAAEAFALAQLA